jgi:hypothetical protein
MPLGSLPLVAHFQIVGDLTMRSASRLLRDAEIAVEELEGFDGELAAGFRGPEGVLLIERNCSAAGAPDQPLFMRFL